MKVSYENNKNATRNTLIKRIADELLRGVKLLESLDDEIYTKTSYGVGSIGSHFRHNLDFANNLLKGIANSSFWGTRLFLLFYKMQRREIFIPMQEKTLQIRRIYKVLRLK